MLQNARSIMNEHEFNILHQNMQRFKDLWFWDRWFKTRKYRECREQLIVTYCAVKNWLESLDDVDEHRRLMYECKLAAAASLSGYRS